MSRLFPLDYAVSTDDWYTPAWVFEGMGVTFDLDVCAPPGGVPWIPAKRYFTEDDDGLSQEWEGFVWCNPPYSAPTRWCRKWARHGNGIILLRADLSVAGPEAAFAAATSMFVPYPRLQFVNSTGGKREHRERVNFSTVLLGVGRLAEYALHNLYPHGTHRRLSP